MKFVTAGLMSCHVCVNSAVGPGKPLFYQGENQVTAIGFADRTVDLYLNLGFRFVRSSATDSLGLEQWLHQIQQDLHPLR